MADEQTDIVLRDEKHDFKLRATGVLLNDIGDVAVNEDRRNGYLLLPGGKIKFGETSQQAIVREFLEEMGIHVRATRLLATTENIFAIDGRQTNEVCFTWLVVRINHERVYAKDDWEQIVSWRSPNDLVDLKPKALQAVLKQLPAQTMYLLNIDQEEG